MPAPPYSVGKIVPNKPSLPSSLIVARGNSPGSSHFMTLGAISRSAKSRTIFFSCSCSSESWKSKPFLRGGNAQRLTVDAAHKAETGDYHTMEVRREIAACYG